MLWESLTDMERLLLMAAAVQGLGPDADVTRANTARVVIQALRWSGLDSAEVRAQWDQGEWPPALEGVYGPLVRMTWQQRTGGGLFPAERLGLALFEGGGNWGVPGDPDCPPCDPQYNSCRLTALGERVALALLEQHPEYRAV